MPSTLFRTIKEYCLERMILSEAIPYSDVDRRVEHRAPDSYKIIYSSVGRTNHAAVVVQVRLYDVDAAIGDHSAETALAELLLAPGNR